MGQYLHSFGSIGEKAGSFSWIESLYIDTRDNLYVVEGGDSLTMYGNRRVQIFDTEGVLAAELKGEFRFPAVNGHVRPETGPTSPLFALP